MGCGTVMLLATVAIYKVTESYWVQQLLLPRLVCVRATPHRIYCKFVTFVNDLITLIQANYCADGFLAIAAHVTPYGRHCDGVHV